LRRWAGLWLFSFITLFLSGCGGGGGSSDAQVRFLQASPNAPQVDVLVDGKSVAGNLAYGNVTGYIAVASGARHVQVVPVSGGSPIFDQSISFTASAYNTLLFTGPASGIQMVNLTDGGTTSTTGDGHVRVINASATMGPADVYIVPAGSGIGGVSPVKSGLTLDQSTGYQLIAAGNYQVFMTTPNTSKALLNTGSIALTSAQNQTVVALDGNAGGFMYALLTDQ